MLEWYLRMWGVRMISGPIACEWRRCAVSHYGASLETIACHSHKFMKKIMGATSCIISQTTLETEG